MSAPTRFLSGFTQAASYQPLGSVGFPDPFFYAEFYDDFLPYVASYYTVTASGGSVAATAAAANAPNGRITFTTAATAASFPEIQPVSCNYTYVPGKKLAFLCRVNLTNITTQTIVAGLITAGNTAPGTVVDGIYFNKAAGSTDVVLTVRSASVTIGTATISGALIAATDIDLGFVITPTGAIKGFVGANLEGVKRPNQAILGPNVGIAAGGLTAALPVTAIAPTLSIGNGTTAAPITATSDFILGAAER